MIKIIVWIVRQSFQEGVRFVWFYVLEECHNVKSIIYHAIVSLSPLLEPKQPTTVPEEVFNPYRACTRIYKLLNANALQIQASARTSIWLLALVWPTVFGIETFLDTCFVLYCWNIHTLALP